MYGIHIHIFYWWNIVFNLDANEVMLSVMLFQIELYNPYISYNCCCLVLSYRFYILIIYRYHTIYFYHSFICGYYFINTHYIIFIRKSINNMYFKSGNICNIVLSSSKLSVFLSFFFFANKFIHTIWCFFKCINILKFLL